MKKNHGLITLERNARARNDQAPKKLFFSGHVDLIAVERKLLGESRCDDSKTKNDDSSAVNYCLFRGDLRSVRVRWK